jgi:hypothetical protein
LADPVALAGIESRPALRVVSAIFNPSPSRPIRFSRGTRTRCSLVTPFSMPRRPMNLLRRSTVIPGESASTTKALMPPRWPSLLGTRAMTTSSSATTPLVVHNFTPSSSYALPSSTGVAVEASRAGSEPTSGSVSRNADMAPAAQRGRNFRFCSSVPASLSGSGTPID